ncbi:hypothetical protein N332_14305, partial [Mesitornis unicolor]
NSPGKLWSLGQGGESWTSHSGETPSPTTISEIQAAEASTSEGSTFPSSGKTLGLKAVKKTSSPTTSPPASQSNGHSDGDPAKDKMGSSSSSKGTSLQSDAGKVPLQQEVASRRDTATGDRSLKQPPHSTGITSTQQDASSKTSSFETT